MVRGEKATLVAKGGDIQHHISSLTTASTFVLHPNLQNARNSPNT